MTTNDMPSLRLTHDELLTRLQARHKWAERLDAKNLAKHERDEKAYLAAFRTACRAALKWDYEKVKKNYGQVEVNGRVGRNGAPSCPMSIVVKLDRAIEFVKQDTRKSAVVSANGEWSAVHWLLTYDDNPPKAALC